ncbi:hypothetical protein DMB90_02280 [Raoultella planticola]|uniref:Uncharacterized protein n=1 Tax=Raoultella planticola TaxID=575 RepID=A0A5P6A9C1_RAOPL|nr:hypothetical protein DMB90_02280 [Raoultella planticola]
MRPKNNHQRLRHSPEAPLLVQRQPLSPVLFKSAMIFALYISGHGLALHTIWALARHRFCSQHIERKLSYFFDIVGHSMAKLAIMKSNINQPECEL